MLPSAPGSFLVHRHWGAELKAPNLPNYKSGAPTVNRILVRNTWKQKNLKNNWVQHLPSLACPVHQSRQCQPASQPESQPGWRPASCKKAGQQASSQQASKPAAVKRTGGSCEALRYWSIPDMFTHFKITHDEEDAQCIMVYVVSTM